jgi:large subunit ribosomal protein L4e
MKANLFDSLGKKKSEIELPSVFETPLREDLVAKAVEIARFESAQPHALYSEAGRRHSASGTISHKRHEWKGHYGKGLARVPRKTMNRHGTQFYWIATEVASTRGGRRVHGPTLWKRFRKINAQEKELALKSAIASTAHADSIVQRYASVNKAPISLAVIESLPPKTKDLMNALDLVYNQIPPTTRNKTVRAGKGKNRGRPHKKSAGILIVVGNKEKHTFKADNIKAVKDLSVLDLYPLGRLAVYTKQSLEDLGK